MRFWKKKLLQHQDPKIAAYLWRDLFGLDMACANQQNAHISNPEVRRLQKAILAYHLTKEIETADVMREYLRNDDFSEVRSHLKKPLGYTDDQLDRSDLDIFSELLKPGNPELRKMFLDALTCHFPPESNKKMRQPIALGQRMVKRSMRALNKHKRCQARIDMIERSLQQQTHTIMGCEMFLAANPTKGHAKKTRKKLQKAKERKSILLRHQRRLEQKRADIEKEAPNYAGVKLVPAVRDSLPQSPSYLKAFNLLTEGKLTPTNAAQLIQAGVCDKTLARDMQFVKQVVTHYVRAGNREGAGSWKQIHRQLFARQHQLQSGAAPTSDSAPQSLFEVYFKMYEQSMHPADALDRIKNGHFDDGIDAAIAHVAEVLAIAGENKNPKRMAEWGKVHKHLLVRKHTILETVTQAMLDDLQARETAFAPQHVKYDVQLESASSLYAPDSAASLPSAASSASTAASAAAASAAVSGGASSRGERADDALSDDELELVDAGAGGDTDGYLAGTDDDASAAFFLGDVFDSVGSVSAAPVGDSPTPLTSPRRPAATTTTTAPITTTTTSIDASAAAAAAATAPGIAGDADRRSPSQDDLESLMLKRRANNAAYITKRLTVENAMDKFNSMLGKATPCPEAAGLYIVTLSEHDLQWHFIFVDGSGAIKAATVSVDQESNGHLLPDETGLIRVLSSLQQNHNLDLTWKPATSYNIQDLEAITGKRRDSVGKSTDLPLSPASKPTTTTTTTTPAAALVAADDDDGVDKTVDDAFSRRLKSGTTPTPATPTPAKNAAARAVAAGAAAATTTTTTAAPATTVPLPGGIRYLPAAPSPGIGKGATVAPESTSAPRPPRGPGSGR